MKSKRALFATLLVAASSIGGVHAQTDGTTSGLGQSWPNAADVSASPHWHVYVFVLNGVEYIQVNDLGGTVRAAVGTAGGTTLVLPVGVDAQNVSTSASTSKTTTVYSDKSTTVTASPQSNGTTLFNVVPNDTCNSTYSCGGGRGG